MYVNILILQKCFITANKAIKNNIKTSFIHFKNFNFS